MPSYTPSNEKTACVPIFRILANEILDFEGSGVLLTYGTRHFLGTAAHVLDHRHREGASDLGFVIGGAKPPIPISRDVQRNALENGVHQRNDAVDFATTEILRPEAERLTERFKFVPLDRATPYRHVPERLHYQLMGYPSKDNCVHDQRCLSANALRMSIAVRNNALAHDVHRKQNQHWFVAGIFDPARLEASDNGSSAGGIRSFSGMSGGAIFIEEPYLPRVFREFAGITLECTPYKNRGAGRFLFVGIGTRAVIDMLHNWHPDLPNPLPPKRGYEPVSCL